MLVLSRRPQEKILFPGTGISIEIVQTKGNTVRVGIEAPNSVRVLRGELAEREDLLADLPAEIQSNKASSLSGEQRQRFVRQIDEIYLAVALAQNQNRQELSDNVGFALDEAMERLDELKNSVKQSNPTENSKAVCESKTPYAVRKTENDQAATLMISPAPDVAFRFEFGFEFDFGVEFELGFSDQMSCVE